MTANRFNPFNYPSNSGGPVGEVPPTTAEDAMSRMVERKGLNTWQHRHDTLVSRALARRTLELNGHYETPEWFAAFRSQRDAEDDLAGTSLAPASLVENRAAEVRRLEEFWADVEVIEKRIEDAPGLTVTGLATGMFTSPKPVDGA